MYGYEIIKELESRSDGYFQFKEGLIYPRLHEMERQGLLRAAWQGSEGTRRRKFYTITESGRRQLRREVQSWQAFAQNINQLLGVNPS
jgi:DNA-binding PadR family transcriptional regulator